MPKPKPIQITIPNPCQQSWDEMTPQGQGRHCAHCQKVVTDFTKWSDTALYEFLKNNNGKMLCGKIQPRRLEQPIIPVPVYRKTFYRFATGLGFTLALAATIPAYTYARAPYVHVSSFTVAEENPVDDRKDSKDMLVITGKVLNEDKKPIANADVYIVNDNSDELLHVKADSNGIFKLEFANSKFREALFLQVAAKDFYSSIIPITPQSIASPFEVELQEESYMGGMIFSH